MIAGGELNKKQLTELRKALASMELPPQKRQRSPAPRFHPH